MKKYFAWLFGILFILAGLNHFISPQFYLNVMPPYIPWHYPLVLLSGVIEVILGGAFLFSKTRRVAAWGIIALLIAVLPAHIYMIQNPSVLPDVPLWVLYARLPIQAAFCFFAWTLSTEHLDDAN